MIKEKRDWLFLGTILILLTVIGVQYYQSLLTPIIHIQPQNYSDGTTDYALVNRPRPYAVYKYKSDKPLGYRSFPDNVWFVRLPSEFIVNFATIPPKETISDVDITFISPIEYNTYLDMKFSLTDLTPIRKVQNAYAQGSGTELSAHSIATATVYGSFSPPGYDPFEYRKRCDFGEKIAKNIYLRKNYPLYQQKQIQSKSKQKLDFDCEKSNRYIITSEPDRKLS